MSDKQENQGDKQGKGKGQCPECGADIENLRVTCPNCGHEYKDKDYTEEEEGSEFRAGSQIDEQGEEIMDEPPPEPVAKQEEEEEEKAEATG